jgi:predicted RND superfamily exporter protein
MYRGIGMVMSWCVAYLLMPGLVRVLDRGERIAGREAQGRLMAPLARAIVRWPAALVIAATALTVASVAQVRSLGASSLEYDFSKLRRADTWTNGEGYWGRQMDDLLGTYLTPTAILTDTSEQARDIAATLRDAIKRPPMNEMVSSVRTIDDVVPRDQEAKIVEAEAIKEVMTPTMRAQIPPDKRELVGRVIDGPRLSTVTAHQVPRTFMLGLLEKDGSSGRAVLVFPRPSHALWEGPPLAAFVDALRGMAGTARVAGSLPLSADILDSIRRDGLKASVAALLGVMLVVLVIFRRNTTTLHVIGSLVIGVLWLAGAMMALGVRINFANFIAFPITFGIGVDYAVNVMSRYVQDGIARRHGGDTIDGWSGDPVLDDDDHRVLVAADGAEPRALSVRLGGCHGRDCVFERRYRRAAGRARMVAPEAKRRRPRRRDAVTLRVFTNFNTKRSLLPRRSPAANGASFQSRVSAGLRRKSPSSASLKPARKTSSTTTFSSMR